MTDDKEREAVDPGEWGCEYCRNDGKLTSNNTCPKCDAQYNDEEPNNGQHNKALDTLQRLDRM